MQPWSRVQISCRELVQQYLDRIETYDQTGPALNAIQLVNPRALQEAEALDTTLNTAASGPVGPLHCIPVLLKDQVETRDMPTTYGSALFDGFVSAQSRCGVVRLHCRQRSGLPVARGNDRRRACSPGLGSDLVP